LNLRGSEADKNVLVARFAEQVERLREATRQKLLSCEANDISYRQLARWGQWMLSPRPVLKVPKNLRSHR